MNIYEIMKTVDVDEKIMENVALHIARGFDRGFAVLACGNGGSATHAQHLVAELVGRCFRDRDPLPAICLNSDIAVMTAISNDYGYENVFARQALAFVDISSAIIGFSTSGKSANVVKAFNSVKGYPHIIRVAFVGGMNEETPLAESATHVFHVKSDNTQFVQEMHQILIHEFVRIVEAEYKKIQQKAIEQYF